MKNMTLTFLLLLAVSSGCKRNQFELQHDRDANQGPIGVEFQIKPLDGVTTFKVGQPLRFEEVFSAKYRNQWHIEVADYDNPVSTGDEVVIWDGNSIKKQNIYPFEFVCCASRHVWLDESDLVLPYPKRDRNPAYWLQLPRAPGKYKLYLLSRRVWDSGASENTPVEWNRIQTASDTLAVEVVR